MLEQGHQEERPSTQELFERLVNAATKQECYTYYMQLRREIDLTQPSQQLIALFETMSNALTRCGDLEKGFQFAQHAINVGLNIQSLTNTFRQRETVEYYGNQVNRMGLIQEGEGTLVTRRERVAEQERDTASRVINHSYENSGQEALRLRQKEEIANQIERASGRMKQAAEQFDEASSRMGHRGY